MRKLFYKFGNLRIKKLVLFLVFIEKENLFNKNKNQTIQIFIFFNFAFSVKYLSFFRRYGSSNLLYLSLLKKYFLCISSRVIFFAFPLRLPIFCVCPLRLLDFDRRGTGCCVDLEGPRIRSTGSGFGTGVCVESDEKTSCGKNGKVNKDYILPNIA